MRPIAAKRTRSQTVANETAWEEEAPWIVSASEHSLSDSLHQRDDDDDDDDNDVEAASVPPLLAPVLDAAETNDDADDAEVEVAGADDATMPHVHARTHAASTVGTCA
jgi:hypothetical protein